MRLTILLGLLFQTGAAQAQAPRDLPLDAATRETLLTMVGQRYDSLYAVPAVGRDLRQKISEKQAMGGYAHCRTASCLSDVLTTDLQRWSGDKHLRLLFSVKPRPLQMETEDQVLARAAELENMRERNFGFHNIERLHGNVGLIEIGRFDPAADAAETAAAAMRFVANTDALIIDLRNNGGGRADMVSHLMSYFVEEQTHLATLRRRNPSDDAQLWTDAHVSAPPYLGKPVYVLTSARTFSGAEALTYTLRHFSAAKVVGETTRGGANPGGIEQLSEHYAVFIPTARTINTKTGTNWDGVGITPDHEVTAADALKTAHRLALQELLQKQAGAPRARMWQQAMDEMFARKDLSAK